MLNGTGIWMDDDLTEREKQIQEWLGSIVAEERKNGLSARLGYLKIKVEDSWYEWVDLEGQIKEMTFRGADEGK